LVIYIEFVFHKTGDKKEITNHLSLDVLTKIVWNILHILLDAFTIWFDDCTGHWKRWEEEGKK